MNRCSFCEWIPILPWPIWPLAGQLLLGRNVVVGSMTLLLAVRGKHCHEKYVGTPVFFTTALHHGLVWSYPCRVSRENSPHTPCSGIAARDRRWDGRWRADCASPASRDSHTRGGDKSASRCRRYGGVGSLAAWDRVVGGGIGRVSLVSRSHRAQGGLCVRPA